MRALLKEFSADRSGMFVVATAILSIPLILAIGMYIDYMTIGRVRAELQAAVDAAAVGAVSFGSPGFQAAGTMANDGPIEAGVGDALNLFNAQLRGDAKSDLTKVKADVVKSGTEISAVVKYNAIVPMMFMQLAGIKSVPISGSATARNGTPAFSDFYLLLDNSPSMGIGATQADIDTMVNNTTDKCAFACHEDNNSSDYYRLAKKLGVTMRIDVMRQAIDQMMDEADSTQTYSNQYRMALYHFGKSARKAGLERVVKLTSNTKNIRNKAKSQIDLMTVPYQNYNADQDTNFNAALEKLDKEISNPGTGENQGSRLKYLFFTTDGVADYANSSGCQKKTTNGRCQEPINTAYCDALKKRGIKIAVLYTTYYPLPTNGWYKFWIAPFADEIGSNLESCASQGLYFEVSPTAGIAEAMTTLFKKIISRPTLIN